MPRSRLLITSPDDTAVRQRILRPFSARGIDPARVTLLARMPVPAYLEAYGGIDIALDPFPYCGGATTCDALWQGVPVLAVRSLRPYGMASATILHQLRMDDWLVGSPDRLVELAVEKSRAESTDALEELRRGLRQRMLDSPLLDAAGVTREVEQVLQAMPGKR